MKIAKRVKIGAVWYKVKIALTWPERNGADGETFYSKKEGNVIYIGADLSPQAQEITLIHEAFHAINSTIDHTFLDSFAEQTYQFLKENKLIK